MDVAIGIVGRPELLFLDEPTAGFDPHARREFHDLVHRFADLEDTTILLTTHDLDEAEKLADRILILAGGTIIADGSADQLSRRMSTKSEVRWSRDGQSFVHSDADPTQFVRELFGQYGEAISDLEVRPASLEDSYMSLWSGSSSPDAKGGRRASSRRWSDEPVDGCRGGGDQARRDRTAADPHQRPGHVELCVLADGLACRYVLPPRSQGTWHGLHARGDVDTERDRHAGGVRWPGDPCYRAHHRARVRDPAPGQGDAERDAWLPRRQGSHGLGNVARLTRHSAGAWCVPLRGHAIGQPRLMVDAGVGSAARVGGDDTRGCGHRLTATRSPQPRIRHGADHGASRDFPHLLPDHRLPCVDA